MKRLSHIWSRIQGDLFPVLNEILDPLTKKQEKLVAILEVLRIEDYIPPLQHGLPGRPKACQSRRSGAPRINNTQAVLQRRVTRFW